MKPLTPQVNATLAHELAPALEQAWAQLHQVGVQATPALLAQWNTVLLGSEYLLEQCVRTPALFAWLEEQAAQPSPSAQVLQQELTAALAPLQDDAAMLAPLRAFRHRYLCRIIWRDLAGVADLPETLHELSLLADSILTVCQERLFALYCQRYGVPKNAAGASQPLVIFAMGKLGAQELNLSSDIDLIFAYETEGELATLSYQQFYTRLGQALIRLLDSQTADGFVYRVDMRLRPWGSVGALASSFESLVAYYRHQGREWERYALIKIRAVAGDVRAGQRLIETLKPFVFRRYLDYGALASLREMKQLIEREVRQQGRYEDIKLGAGGIREIEFIVQVQQLVRGGQELALQAAHLLAVLPVLAEQGLINSAVAKELTTAYVFLRRMEHRLQAWRDQQTQLLPRAEEERARLAFTLGFTSVAECEAALSFYREQVRYQFQQVIAAPEDERNVEDSIDQQTIALWRGQLPKQRAVQVLTNFGVEEAGEVLQQLAAFRQGLPEQWRLYSDSLDSVLPRLLEALGYHRGGAEQLLPLLGLLDVLLARGQHHLELLAENPRVINQIVKLFGMSASVASLVTQHPALMEELLDASALYSFPSLAQLQDELRQQLLRVPAEDVQRQLEVVRHFKQVHQLRATIQAASEQLPLMKVSDYLTWLAEAVINQILLLAWHDTALRYGLPTDEEGNAAGMQCVVVAYGKLGGLELSPDSDLDLVFLYDAPSNAMTNGDNAVSNGQFYTRLCQMLVQILTSHTVEGRLYEVDMRLRPSGNAGPLASTLNAFERYQQEEAWTWEHQALTRARVVAGAVEVEQRFAKIRDNVLRQQRPLQALQQEVLAMREKLYKHHDANLTTDSSEALKFGRGGIVEVEFMVQYGVLRWAFDYPALTQHTDNIRLLDVLATIEQVPAHEAGLLREAYLAYRSAVHRAALGQVLTPLEKAYLIELSQEVGAVWRRWFVNNSAA